MGLMLSRVLLFARSLRNPQNYFHFKTQTASVVLFRLAFTLLAGARLMLTALSVLTAPTRVLGFFFIQ
jgi:hypothetical protein